jgi:hypothetical protein
LKRLSRPVVAQRLAGLLAEHVIVIAREVLTPAEAIKGCGYVVVQRHRSSPGVTLRPMSERIRIADPENQSLSLPVPRSADKWAVLYAEVPLTPEVMRLLAVQLVWQAKQEEGELRQIVG